MLTKSLIFQDHLEKPEDRVLYISRIQGGLNLTNVKVIALSLLIKTFLATAISNKFQGGKFVDTNYSMFNIKTASVPSYSTGLF